MLDRLDVTARLGAAALLGGAIGLNRYAQHKAAGLRTLSLVATGASALVLATIDTANGALHADAMSRVIQGIMTGVGFIGAGVIVRGQTDDSVRGLTTASTVWITAALGALCGIGAWKITLPVKRNCRIDIACGRVDRAALDHFLLSTVRITCAYHASTGGY